MHYVKLSDHLTNQRHAVKTQKEQRFVEQLDQYAQETNELNTQFSELDHMASEALAERKYFRWAMTQCRLMQHFFQAPPQAPAPLTVARDEQKWAASTLGVHRIQEHLFLQLDDRYELFNGYRNADGHIDLLLLGPCGLVAMEVQYVSGHIHCDGDSWSHTSSSRNMDGIQTEVPLVDQYGRSPSERVNAPSFRLQ